MGDIINFWQIKFEKATVLKENKNTGFIIFNIGIRKKVTRNYYYKLLDEISNFSNQDLQILLISAINEIYDCLFFDTGKELWRIIS